MSAATKTTIDPAVEDGAVLLAEEALPPSEGRREKALALEAAWGPFAETRDRISSANDRVDEISRELSTTRGKEREALVAERTALMGELGCAGADIEAVATLYAEALTPWVDSALSATTFHVRRIASEENPLRNQIVKNRMKLTPEMASMAPDVQEQARLEEEIAKWAAELKELVEERGKYEQIANVVSATVSRFGGRGYDGSLYSERGKREWLKRLRVNATRSTIAQSAISDALKPSGAF